MKRAATDHPKVANLADAIAAEHKHQRRFALLIATGTLERLWHFTAKFTPQGDIGKRKDEEICRWVGWPIEDSSTLIRLLIQCEWLVNHPVHRLIVHDWGEHADDSVKKMLQRKGLAFVCLDMSGHVSPSSLPEPEPEPEPTTPARSIAAPQPSPPKAAESGELFEPEPTEPTPDPLAMAIVDAAGKIKAVHPAVRSCGLAEIRKKLQAIVNHKPALDHAPPGRKLDRQLWLLETIVRNHAGWCATEQWRKDNGEYAKGLGNWLAHTMLLYLGDPPAPANRMAPTNGAYAQSKTIRAAQIYLARRAAEEAEANAG